MLSSKNCNPPYLCKEKVQFTKALAKPFGLDNMPLGSTVSIDEVDKGDGFYEGLHYEAELAGTRLLNIPVLDRILGIKKFF